MPQLEAQSFDEQVQAQEAFMARHQRWARHVAIAELSLVAVVTMSLIALVLRV